ncbi:MAG: hypothetical protein ACTHL3_06850 [Candidatus Nitrosocosmicus sp.]
MMILKTMILIVSICTIVFNLTVPGIWGQNSSSSSTEIQKLNSVTIQNTSTSMPAPSAKINNQQIPHSIVVALPIRSDGKIWIGTVTFTASKPIEIEVVHQYLPKVKPDINHGEPSNAKWFDGAPIALSTMTMFSNTPVTITDKPFSVGSFNFAGSALLFHKTNGQPFSVTYTLDAIAKNLTIIK